MRVLFLESHSMWLDGLPNGFRDAGHEVLVSGSLTEKNIPAIISEYSPDLIIMLGWTEEHVGIKRKWIREHVTTTGIPFVYWATEDPIHTNVLTVPFIKQVRPRFVFTVSKEMVPYYESLGFPSAHLDFGYHPCIHKREEKLDGYACSIAVVANAYPGVIKVYPQFYRLQSLRTLISPLLKAGYRVDFWGSRWTEMEEILGCRLPREYVHGYLPYPEAYKVYNSADIVLGLQNTTSQVTMRTYEILGSGGFLLTSNTPAVTDLFEPGQHLAVAATPEETVETVQYYLDHPEEREKTRRQGQTAVACHSYKHRAESIVHLLRQRKIL
ncbi:glycosyltransferase [Sporomusa aerivorans]|uniref:CgeB family protein n=1 Tax=Sporomusa aerivorans TaxID=204936 RepID=UPI00352B3B51